MVDVRSNKLTQVQTPDSPLAPPAIDPSFEKALNDLVAVARQGHRPDSPFFNPSDEWLVQRMRVFQDLPPAQQETALREAERIEQEIKDAEAHGERPSRVWPDVALRLNTGGVAFFSQLGVARRPDLTQYFIDGFSRNRDALAFSEENQALFTEVFSLIAQALKARFQAGDTVIQSDRRIGDVPERSFHARQLLYGDRYLQIPYMWRQLTFDMPKGEQAQAPHILEVSIPHWLDDLDLPNRLKRQLIDTGFTKLVFKAPTKGLSLHLGFDYVGEHKMGPLSVAMFQAKQKGGLAIQAALSVGRIQTLQGKTSNAAVLTVGPSLHGKSTLTIMIELGETELAKKLGLTRDPSEGVYPMNDDIILLQPLASHIQTTRDGKPVTITHSIDGTENNLYAVPFGLNRQDDPITYDVVRGTDTEPNTQETHENVPVDHRTGIPDFSRNPVRNMRMVLHRKRLLQRKGVDHLLEVITGGKLKEGVHVPMDSMDHVFWQGVMRQNTVIPPLRKLRLDQYIRVLMYGEAVQMGAVAGAIGKPYVEYFSDPFIIGLEDDNANVLYDILKDLADGGLPQTYCMFNTGGVGAQTSDEASGPHYRKVPREVTLMLQEALLRDAVLFEHDPFLRSDVAVAIVNGNGEEIIDLRNEWLPRSIYGEKEYEERIRELYHRRYYGLNQEDKAGILRYTKVRDEIIDLDDVPAPLNERELAWLLCYGWHLDQAYPTLEQATVNTKQGRRPESARLQTIQHKYDEGVSGGLRLNAAASRSAGALGLRAS